MTLTYPNDQPYEKVKEKAIELEETMQGMNEVDNIFMQLGNSRGSTIWRSRITYRSDFRHPGKG